MFAFERRQPFRMPNLIRKESPQIPVLRCIRSAVFQDRQALNDGVNLARVPINCIENGSKYAQRKVSGSLGRESLYSVGYRLLALKVSVATTAPVLVMFVPFVYECVTCPFKGRDAEWIRWNK